MSALRKEASKFTAPPRDKTVVKAKPCHGDHKVQLDNAFAATFERYDKALEALAKV